LIAAGALHWFPTVGSQLIQCNHVIVTRQSPIYRADADRMSRDVFQSRFAITFMIPSEGFDAQKSSTERSRFRKVSISTTVLFFWPLKYPLNQAAKRMPSSG
jgi:hypothetical protein